MRKLSPKVVSIRGVHPTSARWAGKKGMRTAGTGRAVLEWQKVADRDNHIGIQKNVWRPHALAQMGTHGTGDKAQGGPVQQVAGGSRSVEMSYGLARS